MPNNTTKSLSSWAEIDTTALIKNITYLMEQGNNPQKKAILMVKADAYGHGLVEVSKIAYQAGISMLGITSFEDAIRIRNAGITLPLLFSGSISADTAKLFHEFDIIATIDSFEALAIIQKSHAKCKFHIKIDSGLHRYGFGKGDIAALLTNLKSSSLKPEGIYTHYSAANDNPERTALEFESFKEVLKTFIVAGYTFEYIHASNSAGTLWLDESLTNTVRLGLAAYGLQPNTQRFVDVTPCLSWRTRIDAVHTIGQSDTVGYGDAWKAPRNSRIGILTVGYSDGFRSRPTHQNIVLCRGHSVPIIGNIMMNHSIVDITDFPDVCLGDTVTLIGMDGNSRITLEDVAEQLRTINEEVVTQIKPSIKRIYI